MQNTPLGFTLLLFKVSTLRGIVRFSWILLILLFVLPEVYTFLLICIITLIETIIVYELYNARNYAQQINK